MQLEMVPLKTPEHWAAYHSIRRTVLFEARGQFGTYDENHPDDRAPNNHPFLLLANGSPVAAVRVDLLPERGQGIIRRLAVVPSLQRQGYGRALLQRAEKFAEARGCPHFVANVAPDAEGFWKKLGYRLSEPQQPEAANPAWPRRDTKPER